MHTVPAVVRLTARPMWQVMRQMMQQVMWRAMRRVVVLGLT
jgi:hypothetical protein